MSEGQLDSIVNGVHFWSGRAILLGAPIDPRRASQERYLTRAGGQMIPSGRLLVDRSLLYGISLRSWNIAVGGNHPNAGIAWEAKELTSDGIKNVLVVETYLVPLVLRATILLP